MQLLDLGLQQHAFLHQHLYCFLFVLKLLDMPLLKRVLLYPRFQLPNQIIQSVLFGAILSLVLIDGTMVVGCVFL